VQQGKNNRPDLEGLGGIDRRIFIPTSPLFLLIDAFYHSLLAQIDRTSEVKFCRSPLAQSAFFMDTPLNQIGMDDYLIKPFSQETLATKLRHWQKLLASGQHQPIRLLGLDWERLRQISEGNAAFEHKLLGLFYKDAQIHLQTLQRAVLAGDRALVMSAVHPLKSASANLGLMRIYAIATELEQYPFSLTMKAYLQELETCLQQLPVFLNKV
jgi:HPt (histidine-containing phosphotransfer) domain-containing protein